MELRSVLAKKKAFERDRIDRIEDRIARKTAVTFPDASDVLTADRRQSETLAYPMDALVLAAAESAGVQLVSFDAELRELSAVAPEELL